MNDKFAKVVSVIFFLHQSREEKKYKFSYGCGWELPGAKGKCPTVSTRATTKNRYQYIHIRPKSLLQLLLIRRHHIYDIWGHHQQELSHPVPKVEKGKGSSPSVLGR